MKTLLCNILLSVAVAMAALPLSAQTQKKTSAMEFDHTEWDFGRIREQDGVVEHTFVFVNRGSEPLVIQDVAVSCGCTRPTFSRKPVRPGQRGEIKIAYDPTNRPGGFTKEIFIIGSRNIQGTTISIRGEVIGRPRSIEEDYPSAVGSGFRIASRSENIDYVSHGTTLSKTVGYANGSDKEIAVAVEVVPEVDYFRITVPQKIAPGERGQMVLTYDLRRSQPYGLLPVRVYFTVDGRRSDIPLRVMARGIENFKGVDMERAPECAVSVTYHNFGDVKRGDRVSKRITVTNKGRSPLVIRNVQTEEGLTAAVAAGTVIEAGESLAVELTLDTSAAPSGRWFRNLSLTVNDPQRPFREVRLVANVI